MDYYTALHTCGLRYQEMLKDYITANKYWGWPCVSHTAAEDLWTFIQEFIHGCESVLPLNKLNRWLGYIQGTLIALEVTTVQTERDWTRPLFRPLDYA